MPSDYRKSDYTWIRELLDYPRVLAERLGFFDDTSQIQLPDDPIERVIFQDRAKMAIRKVAQNRGHMLMVGRPGTGKSMLAEMFKDKEPLSYSMSGSFKSDDVIDHKTFGMGIVISASCDKMEVAFSDGPRVLVCNR